MYLFIYNDSMQVATLLQLAINLINIKYIIIRLCFNRRRTTHECV